MKKIFFTVLAVLIAGGAVLFQGCLSGKAQEVAKGANVGQRPAANTFTSLDGNMVTLPLTDGGVSIINLWATWCPPCREEMPELEAFYQKNKDKVKFFAVNIQEDAKTIKDFMSKNKYTFPVYLDPSGVSTGMLVTRGIPTTVVLDGKGVVVFRKIGPVTADELEKAVNSAK